MRRRRNPARVKTQVTAQTVSSVLSSSRPSHGNLVDAQETLVRGPRLDGAPADGLAVEVRDEAAGRVGVGMLRSSSAAEPERTLLGGSRLNASFGCSLYRWHWQIAAPPRAPKHGLEVLPSRLIRGDDRDPGGGGGVGHGRRLFRSIGAYDDD